MDIPVLKGERKNSVFKKTEFFLFFLTNSSGLGRASIHPNLLILRLIHSITSCDTLLCPLMSNEIYIQQSSPQLFFKYLDRYIIHNTLCRNSFEMPHLICTSKNINKCAKTVHFSNGKQSSRIHYWRSVSCSAWPNSYVSLKVEF